MPHREIIQVTAETADDYAEHIVMHPTPRRQLIEALPRNELYLLMAKFDGEVAGQVGINPHSPGQADTLKHISYPTPSLAFMHVADNYRRRGIGGELLRNACDFAAAELGARSIFLTVEVSNEPAQALYVKHGFRDWGHGTVMRRQFPPSAEGLYPEEPVVMEMSVLIKDLIATPPAETQ